jgi:hypothetical protein
VSARTDANALLVKPTASVHHLFNPSCIRVVKLSKLRQKVAIGSFSQTRALEITANGNDFVYGTQAGFYVIRKINLF